MLGYGISNDQPVSTKVSILKRDIEPLFHWNVNKEREIPLHIEYILPVFPALI